MDDGRILLSTLNYMETIEQEIQNKFGKIIRKFKVYHHGWEIDGYGYLIEEVTDRFNVNTRLVLTNHSKPYIADVSELRIKIHEYQYAIGETNEIISLLNATS